MNATIDFTTWTDAQLNSALMFADSSPTGLALVAEIDRRKAEGIWLTDGSTERVAQSIRDNTPASRRKFSRRARR
jgi:hypothetical protein